MLQPLSPSFLLSYANLRKHPRFVVDGEWVLDSGAYSVLTSGVTIDLQEYIDACHKQLMGRNPPVTIFALDVIGDPEKSLRNAEEMRRQGIPVVSTFHYGSSWSYLPATVSAGKVALGGLVQRGGNGAGLLLRPSQRLTFLTEAFSRIWPVSVHGFGCADVKLTTRVPFTSVDATSWGYGLFRYGLPAFVKGVRVPNPRVVAPSTIRGQIIHYLNVQAKVRETFGHVLEKNGLPEFTLRFAIDGPRELAHFFTKGAKA